MIRTTTIAEDNPFVGVQLAHETGWAGGSAVGMGEILCV